MERSLAKAANDHLKRARLLGDSLDLRMKRAREASEEWEPNDRFREDFQMVSQTIKEAGAMMLRAQEAEIKKLEGLSDEQLVEQLKHEMRSLVATMSDEEWADLCRIRDKRKAGA